MGVGIEFDIKTATGEHIVEVVERKDEGNSLVELLCRATFCYNEFEPIPALIDEITLTWSDGNVSKYRVTRRINADGTEYVHPQTAFA
jgi:hypothetical protein